MIAYGRRAAFGILVLAASLAPGRPVLAGPTDNGQCWDAVYSTAVVNNASLFKAKSD